VRGDLPDQAALVGVLRTLYDLGLPLLSVACEPAPAGPPAPNAGGGSDPQPGGDL
jgi:hypothetical protein